MFLYRSGLWGPLLRSLYNKKKQGFMFELLLGNAEKRPGSSILFYQAREKGFWAALEAWKQTAKTSPLPNLVF